MTNLKKRLKQLPKATGIYFFKSASGAIIYVGKAAVLQNRVRQYFQKNHGRDFKTEALVADIAGLDWMLTDSETEALFLEAEMIRRYKPRYNILLRDDKSMAYIRVDYDSDYPTVSITRQPLDDGARYYGPYLSAMSVKQALKHLRKIFPFATKRSGGRERASLHYHLGLDPGLEEGKTSLRQYRTNLRRLMAVIEGRRKVIERGLECQMKRFAKNSQFEEAARVKSQLYALRRLSQQIIFSDKEFQDITKDHALVEMVELFGLAEIPRRIEGYDVSHISGTDVVASMVVFVNGVPSKSDYRKFKTKVNKNDDFHHIYETLKRRFNLAVSTFQTETNLGSKTAQGPLLSNLSELSCVDDCAGDASERWSTSAITRKKKNVWKLRLPDLVVIDGGRGQLAAAIRARDEAGLDLPIVGLAKREEEIIVHRTKSKVSVNAQVLRKLGGFSAQSSEYMAVSLPGSANLIKLFQRVRDEAHRFAVSYHLVLKSKRQTASLLDEIPTIGPVSRQKLLKTFGSMRGVMRAREEELERLLGTKKAKILKQCLQVRQSDAQPPN